MYLTQTQTRSPLYYRDGGGTTSPASVLLLDGCAMFRTGLRHLLREHGSFEVVADAATLEQALESIQRLKPAAVIGDLDLPEDPGFALIKRLRADCPSTAIVVLTRRGGEEQVREALTAGANAYLSKDSLPAELFQCLHAVLASKLYVSASSLRSLTIGYTIAPNRIPAGVRSITHREREVLKSIALGHSNKVTAREMGLSVKTVEKHRSNLMQKLRLHNTASVTMFAIRHGILT